MSDKPYSGDYLRLLGGGERVAWVDLDGTMFTGVIQGPVIVENGVWTITIAEEKP